MLARLWRFLLLTFGITPKGEDVVQVDKWAEARKLKEREERARREGIEERGEREAGGEG